MNIQIGIHIYCQKQLSKSTEYEFGNTKWFMFQYSMSLAKNEAMQHFLDIADIC